MFVAIEDIDRRPSRHLLGPILRESIQHGAAASQVAMLVDDVAFYRLAAQQIRSIARGKPNNRQLKSFQGIDELMQRLPIVVESEVRSRATTAAVGVIIEDIASGGR